MTITDCQTPPSLPKKKKKKRRKGVDNKSDKQLLHFKSMDTDSKKKFM